LIITGFLFLINSNNFGRHLPGTRQMSMLINRGCLYLKIFIGEGKNMKQTKKAMTKLDMIDQISKDAVIPKTAARAALDSFVAMCGKEIKSGRSLRVAGLGTFSLRKTKARKGMNPKTGEAIKIAAKKRMAFKPSSVIKELLNPPAAK
jgi:DNA-binding protein HU-beta